MRYAKHLFYRGLYYLFPQNLKIFLIHDSHILNFPLFLQFYHVNEMTLGINLESIFNGSQFDVYTAVL